MLIIFLTITFIAPRISRSNIITLENTTKSSIEEILIDIEPTTKVLKNDEIYFDILQYDEHLSNLTLSVKLDEAFSMIEGILTVDYYNNDPLSIDRIPFHLYPFGMEYETRQGEINVLNIITTGSPSTNLIYEVLSNQQLMWVNLTSPLGFNQSISFRITFTTTLPDGQDRANSYGFNSNQSRIHTCTAFYPIPCVYDEYDGWNTDAYLEIGDPFYFDMAYYDLVVEVPNGMIVAATGELLDSTSDGITTIYHYNPHYPVREMVFSVSRYFQVESKIVNGVNVSCYYLPHSSWLWEKKALNTTVKSLILFNNSFGSYPYSTFNVVEAYGFYGGMEYPCQVQISESIDDQHPEDYEFFQELIIAHETAHQWWCQLVGNDQIDWGHLDEGLTCWSTDYYFDYYNPSWHYFEYYWPLDIVRTYYKNNNQPSKINQSIYDFLDTNMSYRFTAYTKSPLIMQKLRLTIGHENYIAGLRHFFEKYKFKLASFPDLQRSFEKVTGESLNWFFLPWFDNPYLPKYSFKSVDFDPDWGSMIVTVEDLNEDKNDYPYSQQLFLQVMDIHQLEVFYHEYVWINGTTTLNFELFEKRDAGLVLLVYESDVLVQLTSIEETVLVYDFWPKSNLVKQVELSVYLISICVILGYIVWIVRRKKSPKNDKKLK